MIDPITPMLLVIIPALLFCWHLDKVRGGRDVLILSSIFMLVAIIIEFLGVYGGAYEYIWKNYFLNSIFVSFGWIVNIYPKHAHSNDTSRGIGILFQGQNNNKK